MAIVQISKIIHRVGANIDLPQLDTGEIGFSSDTRQVFIGNDPLLYPPVIGSTTTQTELLTDQSSIDFSRLNGSGDVTMELSTPQEGQILALANIANIMTVVNAGVSTTNTINLGDVEYLKIGGTSFNGAILQTDGTGNLTWTTNGMMRFEIGNISQANPAVVTTTTPHFYNSGAQVTLYDFAPSGTGMVELLADGTPAGSCQFWIARTGPTTFTLYEDAGFTMPVDTSGYTPSVPNTGFCFGAVPQSGNATAGGANTQVQFNDGGGFMGSGKFTFNKGSGNVGITGNLTVASGKFYGDTIGAHDGSIGATTPNSGAFTSLTASTTAIVTGNLTAGNISTAGTMIGASANIAGNINVGNANVAGAVLGSSATITGNVTANNAAVANTLSFGYAGGNTWHMFANVDGIFLTDSFTGNTFQVNLTQV